MLPGTARAWGFTGHELIDAAAMQQAAPGLPAFLLTPNAILTIVSLGPELDRSKGSGKPHDPDLDPGHYVDIGDDGKIAGTVDLDALPPSRRASRHRAGWRRPPESPRGSRGPGA